MSLEALGNSSADIVRILVLFMTAQQLDGASGSCRSFSALVILRKKMVAFGVDVLVC